MGKGFCFIGNQYRLEVDGDEFFIDLLFFNHHLQCLIAFELKKGKFKPADAGHLNFYQNVLDEKVKLQQENSSIGIVDSNYFQNMMMINCKILQNVLTELLTDLFLKRFTKINDIKSLIIFSLFEIMFLTIIRPFFSKLFDRYFFIIQNHKISISQPSINFVIVFVYCFNSQCPIL